MKLQDKQLPDPMDLYPSSFQLKLFEMLTLHTLLALLPLTKSTNPGGARGGECKQSRDSYVKLMPVQKAQIAKYALASSNKAAILSS